MSYSSDKKPLELTALTSLATDDTFIVGDTSDTAEVAKSITKANLITDLTTSFATAAQGATADTALQNVVEDTTPQLGGALDINSNDITDGTVFKYDATNKRLSIGTDENTVSIAGATALGSKYTSETEGATDLVDFFAHRHSATAGFGTHMLTGRSRGTPATPTVVSSGDKLSILASMGYDGTDWELATSIDSEVDGTPGTNDMPGRLIFKVTPDGGATPAEAMRISQDKAITMAGTLDVTGAVTVSSTVDGRDLATDGTKLDGIEALADVTDTANVTSAGALMDSELTSIADVKALNQSVVSGATPTFTTTNFTDATNKRLLTDAQEALVDGSMQDLVDDTTPQLGGELDAGAHSIGFTMQTATGDGTTTIDWKLGNHFDFTFGAFNETFTFTAPTKSGVYTLSLKQDSVGSRTATWPATVKWAGGGTAPTLTTTATTGYDIVSFRYDGTNYYAVPSLNFS